MRQSAHSNLSDNSMTSLKLEELTPDQAAQISGGNVLDSLFGLLNPAPAVVPTPTPTPTPTPSTNSSLPWGVPNQYVPAVAEGYIRGAYVTSVIFSNVR